MICSELGKGAASEAGKYLFKDVVVVRLPSPMEGNGGDSNFQILTKLPVPPQATRSPFFIYISISSQMLMCGEGVRSILLLPLVARCLETIDVCIWHMFVLCLL